MDSMVIYLMTVATHEPDYSNLALEIIRSIVTAMKVVFLETNP